MGSDYLFSSTATKPPISATGWNDNRPLSQEGHGRRKQPHKCQEDGHDWALSTLIFLRDTFQLGFLYKTKICPIKNESLFVHHAIWYNIISLGGVLLNKLLKRQFSQSDKDVWSRLYCRACLITDAGHMAGCRVKWSVCQEAMRNKYFSYLNCGKYG